MVNAERELHALDGTRSAVETGLAVALLFSSALLDHIGGMIPFESRSLKFNNAPAKTRGSVKVSYSAKVCHMPSFLLVEFVSHMLGEPLELSLRAGVVGIDHKVLEVP